MRSSRGQAIALAAILCLAAALRLVGIRFGLPAVYNADETAIMSRALAFATGDLNPHNFVYPTLYFYLLFGWIGAYAATALALGRIESLAALERQFFTDPTDVFLAGRLLGVVCGVATVAALYVLAHRLFGRRVALASALFLAVAPTAVRDAHYVKHDVPATLLVVLALIAIVRVWPLGRPDGRPRTDLAFAAAVCGAAASLHYYTVFLVLPLAVAIWFRLQNDGAAARLRALTLAALIAASAFLICSPFILVEWRTAARDIAANREIVVDRAVEGGGTAFASASRYLTMLWRDAIGWPVALLAVLGFAVSWRLSARLGLVLALFPAAFLAFISNTVPAGRYLNPVLPFIALFAGVAVSWLSSRTGTTRRGPMAAVLAAGAALPGLAESVRTDLFFRQADTRTLAADYIESRVAPGSTVIVQPYSAPLRASRASLTEATMHHLGSLDRASTKVRLQLGLEPYPEPSYRLFYLGDGGLDTDKIYVEYRELGGRRGLERLRQLSVQYVVVTRYNDPRAAVVPFLDALTREARLVAVFSPYRRPPAAGHTSVAPYLHNTDASVSEALERPGPVIELWRLI